MAYNIELHPVAEVEFWHAVDWYDEQREDLGKAFAKEFDRLLGILHTHPNRFPLINPDRRKAPFQKFPYRLVFEIVNDTVRILGVVHTSRDPKSWENR